MGKPWEFNGGPGPEKIREMITAGMSAGDIAKDLGVGKSTAEHYMRRAGYTPQSQPRMSHRELIPWEINSKERAHVDHGIRFGLRAWSKERQGAELTRSERSQLNTLRRHLAYHGRVVDYSRDEGWKLVPRDPAIDDPDLPIRRPS